ncbi:MAG: hypothetical protein AB1393_11600, partial [Candidatus Edwardsbacteria bacterium]
MKEVNSTLTDWEALYLWHDVCWTPRTEKLTEQEVARELLKRGWLEKHRKEFGSGKVLLNSDERMQWVIKNGLLKKKTLKNGKEGYLLNEKTIPFEGKGVLTATFVDGTYLFRKHGYNKDQGLLVAADEKGVDKAVVAIWAWNQSGGPKTIRGRCFTDANGYFSTYVDLESGYLWRVWAALYPMGANSTNALDCAIKVSDPSGPYLGWKVPEDTTIYHFTCDSILQNVTPGIDHHVGTTVVDTFPAYRQPRSGAVNIYQTLLQGYNYLVPTYTSGAILGKVRALWEPGYNVGGSSYNNDTIWVDGDTLLVSKNTDEWDDMVLLHEFGHHIMNKCAQIPPCTTTYYDWWHSYPGDKNLAYTEGWPDMFPSVVTDSIYSVNTGGGIGGDTVLAWENIENPWEYYPMPDSLEASPWTIGSVAGALWDIYDLMDEIPYPSYPTAGFPDTGLADSLDGGFSPVWNISDNYQTKGHYCYTIWDFLEGWENYKYNHNIAKDNIMIHHRIYSPNSVPTRAISLEQKPNLWDIIIKWASGLWPYKAPLQGIAAGYNVYRLGPGDTLYQKINTTLVTDTFYVDTNTYEGNTYSYYITGVDSSAVEGPPSHTASITVQHIPWLSTSGLATAFNNGRKLACDSTGINIHLVYQSTGKIWYTKSTDGGTTWSPDTAIGEGEFPAIALDKDENPNTIWSKKISLNEAEIYFSRYTAGGWTAPFLLGIFPIEYTPDIPGSGSISPS